LTVETAGKRVLKDVDLEISEGEVHVLFGPNGSGKTSLIMSILGFPNFRVVSGEIWFKGVNITGMSIDQRVKLGIGVAFQNPPAVRGVKLGDILNELARGEVDANKLAGSVNLPPEFLGRDLNLGFSGGELKRSEILQVLAQRPDFAIFDEPDSGVDIENLEVVGKAIEDFLDGRTGLLVTHMGHILRYVDVDRAHVLLDGTIACSGKPTQILGQIMREGYRWCERCPRARKPV
jgi:Fe-S cluster assembly ATP-binding protein